MPNLSRLLQVIGTDTNRSATYDFLLVFHSNCGPIWYRFQDKGQYLQNFPTSRTLNAPAQGFPSEFVAVVACKTAKNYSHVPTRLWKESDNMRIRLGTIPECADRQTDRQTYGFANTMSCSACITYWYRRKTNTKEQFEHARERYWSTISEVCHCKAPPLWSSTIAQMI